jgi:GLPGLI family protein
MDKPLNIGPKKYFGLPGLVIKVERAGLIIYELKTIRETQIEPKKLSENQEVISEKEYNDIIKQMSNGIFEN